jgi:ATP-dependent DNA helicase RecQ
VYCLTVSEAERVGEFLRSAGIDAASYTGATPPEERARIEAALDRGEVSCVVATSALGMGYDNPHLSHVVHLGSPSSPIAYYQQVGRAGRGGVDADAVLLPTRAERDIWAYFDATAMPPEPVVAEVLAALDRQAVTTVAQLEGMVNLRRGRLEALLKVLDVEGAVERDGSGWRRTGAEWSYDSARYEQLRRARRAEQQAMIGYQTGDRCRLRVLREQLDDPGAEDCGRCDVCTGVAPGGGVDPDVAAAARAFLRATPVVLEPRKQWPRGLEGRRGNIAPELRAEEGRALAFGNDPGWAEDLAARFAAPDAAPDDELLRAVAAMLKAWDWGRRPTWVTWVPSRTRPLLVEGLARRLAEIGRLEAVEAVRRVRHDAPPQSAMENSLTQAANVLDAFTVGRPGGEPLPTGPGLLVDDLSRSGWTLTVVAEGLRAAGAGLVLPAVLWRRP